METAREWMQKYSENVFLDKAILMKATLCSLPDSSSCSTTQIRFNSLAVFIRFRKAGDYPKETKGEHFP